MGELDLRQLRCFVAVAEYAHFGRAAMDLGLTASAVSRSIGALERTLSTTLFDRTSRRVRLTAQGADLLEEATRVLHGLNRLHERAIKLTAAHEDVTRLGYRSTSRDLMRRIVRAAASIDPLVEFVPICLTVAEMTAALLADEIDVGLSVSMEACSHALVPGSRAIGLHTIRHLEFSRLIAPRSHPLVKLRRPLDVRDLDGQRLIVEHVGSHPAMMTGLRQFFLDRGLCPEFVEYRVSSVENLIDLVALGHGAVLLPAQACPDLRGDDDVSVLEVRGDRPPYVEFLVWRQRGGDPTDRRAVDTLIAAASTIAG